MPALCVHQGVFSQVLGGKRRKQEDGDPERPKSKKSKQAVRDEEHYVPYRAQDLHTERG